MTPADFNPFIEKLASDLARAIELAEGGNIPGTLPFRIHNPGDMELGDKGWGTEQGKTIYLKADWNAEWQDHTDGCSALRRECLAILTGGSGVYSVDDTFLELAGGHDGNHGWTGGDNPGAWAKIVCAKLNVETIETLAEWVKSQIDEQGETA